MMIIMRITVFIWMMNESISKVMTSDMFFLQSEKNIYTKKKKYGII